VSAPAEKSGCRRVLAGCGIFFGLALFGFVLLVGVVGFFVYQAYKEHEANPGYVPIASAQCAYNRAAGDSALAVEMPDMDLGYPTNTYDRLYVRNYVREGQYDFLDTLLMVYADSVRRDYRVEYRMFDLYNAFDVADTTLKPFLDTWVAERPQSANARLVRATWLTAVGEQIRGEDVSANTDRSKFRSLHDYLDLAKADVQAAHAIDPCSLVGYHILMLAAAHDNGNTALSRQLMEQALTIQPYSFLMRARHMYNLRPRWGGSYRKMDDLAQQADSFIARNPRLRALHGFSVWDRADESERSKDTLTALAQYDSSLAFGDFWQFNLDRGQYMYRLDHPEAALTNLERALAQRPQHVDVLAYLARVHYELGRLARGRAEERATHYHEAYRYIDLAIELDPRDESIRRTRKFYQEQIPQFAPAPPG
jgi:tetratricopeptide (TPR) repeat protein